MKDFDLIVAVSMNGVIGNSTDNSIPWYLPRDLQHFKKTTLGKTIVMGSKTWTSLPVRPLKGRRNVVISRQEIGFTGADAQYSSLKEALEKEDNVIVIGGGQIYEDCLQYHPKQMFITIVDAEFKGDVKFPIDGEDMLLSDVIAVEGVHYIATHDENMDDNGYKAMMKVFVRP